MSEITTTLWRPLDVVPVPRDATTPDALVGYAQQLTRREVQQVVDSFANGNYEIGTVFVWQKAMAGLKKKLGALGMDFIAEMLDRKDITAASNPAQVLTDHDALRLAEELGFFPSTHSLRLRHALTIVSHFADPPPDADEGMTHEEAVGALRVCIQTVLGHATVGQAVEFARFRKNLEERTFQSTDNEVMSLVSSPYFFRRTTLRVLLAIIKTGQGARLEHSLANLNAFLHPLWPDLLQPDRQMVGWCYAELHADGRQAAAQGVRSALLRVKGFDYVPESLRSRTYLEAAQQILDAHFGWNNFYTEYAPTLALAELGTTIPTPALAKCLTALLCVILGNHYGISNMAWPVADGLLDALGSNQWDYYLNQCLPADDYILSKLKDFRIIPRFNAFVEKHKLDKVSMTRPQVRRLIESAKGKDVAGVATAAAALLNEFRRP